jgi:multimeric flavodoxin WrbA
MKVIVLNGSARGLKGVTGRLVKALVNGLSEGGAEAKQFQLQGLDISPCTACLSCSIKPWECAIKII